MVLGRPSLRSPIPPFLYRKRPFPALNLTKRSLSPTEFRFPATSQATARTPPLLQPSKGPKPLVSEERRGNSFLSSFEFAGLEAVPIRITHLKTRRNDSVGQQRLPDPRLWRYRESLQRRKQRYWGYRKTADKALDSADYGLSLPLYSVVMDSSPAPLRFSAYTWPSLLKAISKAQSALRLPLLETILFDPATSKIHLWVHSDSRGLLNQMDKDSLLKADLLAACMRTILTPAEQDLYVNEVQSLLSSSESMVSRDSAAEVPLQRPQGLLPAAQRRPQKAAPSQCLAPSTPLP